MKIGIDISVLQTGHRMRGIGYTVINFVNHLPKEAKLKHTFVFFMYEPDDKNDNPLNLLDLDGLEYETRFIKLPWKSSLRLPGKLNVINSLFNYIHTRKDLFFGDSRIKNLAGVDRFMQFSQSQALPARRKVKSSVILYDLIQYVMEYDYLPSYQTARTKQHSRKGAWRLHQYRRNYISKLERICRKAGQLIAISQHTKDDFVKFLGIKPEKIDVCLLGVSSLLVEGKNNTPGLKAYLPTSWGDIPGEVVLNDVPFLLFVGGADPRRKLNDLVAAFNNLRAQGHDLKLVLAGDTMLGASKVPNVELQEYLKHTSYIEDILFVGFVDDFQRDWLYKNAVAFVYPSVYEGFGLPILEAMQYGTPVITYKNSSIEEIAGNAAIFAEDYLKISDAVSRILTDPEHKQRYIKAGRAQAKRFTWNQTSKNIIKSVEKAV